MGRNLTNLYISQSFQFLTQVSGSELQDGLGNTITGSLAITASLANTALTANTASYVLNAVSASFATSASQATNSNTAISSSFSTTATSASYAATSTSSSFATNANSASYATNALSSSYAITASFALNAGTTVSTASLLTTASAVNNVITFTKGDGSTFPVTIATGSAVSASFATTASLALNNVLTASVNSNTITFTKGDGTTFPITVDTGSAVTVNTGSLLVTASISNATTTFTKGDGSTFSITANNVINADSASLAATATTASFAQTIADGLSPTFANVTASNVLITGTASVALLYTQTVSSSVIFTSGSNQLGDNPTLDTQSLYGRVIVTGSLEVSGSANFQQGLTGSLQGTASFANNATSASYALSASFAPSSPAFPYTGSAQITGSLSVTGSNSTNGRLIVSQSVNDQTEGAFVLHSNRNGQSLITMYEYGGQAYIKAPRANGNFYIQTAGGANDFIAINDASLQVFPGKILANTPTTISSSLTVTGSVVSTLGFTGSLLGTASFANNTISASFATSASYAATASLLLGSIESASYAATASTAVDFTVSSTASINILTGNVTSSLVRNTADTYTSSPAVQQIVTLTQAEYNAIGSPNANTLYIISGSTPINSAGFATTGSNTFIGNQTISGSLNVSGSSNFTGGDFKVTDQNHNGEFDVDAFKVNTQTGLHFTGSVNSLNGFTGSLAGTASFATTASYVLNAVSSSFASTASFYDLSAVTQNAVFSGSVRGDVSALSISSQTASLDCSTGNFFTLLLVSGSNTFVNPTNILPGQTINLRVKQASVASGSISFASSVKQVSGSAYTPTDTANGEDVVTFISFDSTNLYLSNIKNFI